MNVTEIVRQQIAQVCALAPQEIKEDANLSQYGFDSLKSMELIAGLETHFAIAIHDDEMEGLRTVGDVVRAVEAALGGGDECTSTGP